MTEGVYISVEINIEQVTIKAQNILNLLGYSNGPSDIMVSELVDKKIQQAVNMISPRAGFIVKKLDKLLVKEGWLSVNNTDFFIQKVISSQLKKAEYLAFFAATIGSDLEKLSRNLLGNAEPLEGYILDLIGSEAAEGIATIAHKAIESTISKKGMSVTNRFSPGYCNWNIREQFKLFTILPGKKLGISLTDSAFMSPIKSVSGIVGIGKEVQHRPYICSKCDNKKCIYRNRANF